MPVPSPETRVEQRSKPLERRFNACLLKPSDVPPSRPDLEVIGVFNPGAVQTKDGVVLLVRVAEQAAEKRNGFTPLPRWDFERNNYVINWTPSNELTPIDVRVVRRNRDGLVRLTFISHLRVFYSKDGRTLEDRPGAWLEPANAGEE